MKNILIFALFLGTAFSALIRSFVDEQGRTIDQHVDSHLARGPDGGLYRITYDAEILGGNFITSLDSAEGIAKVLCDVNDIEMIIDFHSIPEAYALYNKIKDEGYEKYITSLRHNCTNSKNRPFVNIKEVLNVELNRNQILIRTALGSYERLFRNANVKVEPISGAEGYDKTLCFGVNANEDCTAAAAPFPLYQNDFIDLSCTNCFVGTKATANFAFKISWFRLRRVAVGFKDISVNGAFVLDMTATAATSGGIDKTYVASAGVVLQFWIGPIPIVVIYQIPIRILGDAMIEAKATGKIGAVATWKLGDAFVEWNEHSGWQRGRMNPKFTWSHELDGDLTLQAAASLSIIPSVELSLLRIVTAGFTMTPNVRAAASGSLKEKQLCADLFYRVHGDIYASINMNIPFIKSLNWKYGPHSLFDTKEQNIGHKCIRKDKEATA